MKISVHNGDVRTELISSPYAVSQTADHKKKDFVNIIFIKLNNQVFVSLSLT